MTALCVTLLEKKGGTNTPCKQCSGIEEGEDRCLTPRSNIGAWGKRKCEVNVGGVSKEIGGDVFNDVTRTRKRWGYDPNVGPEGGSKGGTQGLPNKGGGSGGARVGRGTKRQAKDEREGVMGEMEIII